MRKLSQRIMGSAFAISLISFLVPVLAHAQTYRYTDTYTMDDAGGAVALGGAVIIFYLIGCCISLSIPIICAVVVYRDAKKNNVENAILWVLLSFFFSIIGLLVYFLAIKPEAVRKNQMVSQTTPPTQPE